MVRSEEKGTQMASDETSAQIGGAAVGAGRPAFDTSVASQARMYDYLLGGKDNYAVDRAAVEEALKVWPEMAFTAKANRAFLGRAVCYLAGEAGIRQFLDIGTASRPRATPMRSLSRSHPNPGWCMSITTRSC